jgi:Txe/YoeB family toxin of toxin-antitoxin system
MYKILRTAQAKKGAAVCERAGFKAKLDKIIDTVKKDPYAPTQGFERLFGNLNGYCSRRINHGNRFVYEVFPNTENAKDKDGNLYDGIVCVYEIWGHRYKSAK